MSETKHTQGPWAVNEDGFKIESEREHGWVNDGWVICVTHGTDQEANARLIAAAPEMLEALKACRLELSYCKDQLAASGYESREGGSVMEALRLGAAAIAKAEGRS